MSVGRVLLLTLILGCVVPQSGRADPISMTEGQDPRSPVMRIYGQTDPPYAFWRFCDEFAADCARSRSAVADPRVELKPEALEQLNDINLEVNHSIEPVTDQELYGVSDYWTLPKNGKGDCEDYALLKRHLLMAAGWPASALLITVVRDEKFEGHAVLTARTNKGDYILDNKSDAIKLWSHTNYLYVMRQSYLDPKVWMALDPAQSAPPPSIAMVEKH